MRRMYDTELAYKLASRVAYSFNVLVKTFHWIWNSLKASFKVRI
jgi:hypothetical protein